MLTTLFTKPCSGLFPSPSILDVSVQSPPYSLCARQEQEQERSLTDDEKNRGVQLNDQQFIHEYVNHPVYEKFNPKQTCSLASLYLCARKQQERSLMNDEINNGVQINGQQFIHEHLGLNVSTTPLRQWGFRQCLSFSWTTLRGKHCGHPPLP